ncbi:MAG: hypothetical protein ACOH1L_06500, partial [Thermomonas sp.]
ATAQVLACKALSPHNARLAASGWLGSLWIDAVAGQVQEARFLPATGRETLIRIAHVRQRLAGWRHIEADVVLAKHVINHHRGA